MLKTDHELLIAALIRLIFDRFHYILACNEPSDVAFILDMSGSIELLNFRKQVEFVREVVYGLNMPQHRVALATFGNQASLR